MKQSILLTLNQDRIPKIKQIADQKGISRLDVIRSAIDEYLEKNLVANSLDSIIESGKQVEVAEPTAA